MGRLTLQRIEARFCELEDRERDLSVFFCVPGAAAGGGKRHRYSSVLGGEGRLNRAGSPDGAGGRAGGGGGGGGGGSQGGTCGLRDDGAAASTGSSSGGGGGGGGSGVRLQSGGIDGSDAVAHIGQRSDQLKRLVQESVSSRIGLFREQLFRAMHTEKSAGTTRGDIDFILAAGGGDPGAADTDAGFPAWDSNFMDAEAPRQWRLSEREHSAARNRPAEPTAGATTTTSSSFSAAAARRTSSGSDGGAEAQSGGGGGSGGTLFSRLRPPAARRASEQEDASDERARVRETQRRRYLQQALSLPGAGSCVDFGRGSGGDSRRTTPTPPLAVASGRALVSGMPAAATPPPPPPPLHDDGEAAAAPAMGGLRIPPAYVQRFLNPKLRRAHWAESEQKSAAAEAAEQKLPSSSPPPPPPPRGRTGRRPPPPSAGGKAASAKKRAAAYRADGRRGQQGFTAQPTHFARPLSPPSPLVERGPPPMPAAATAESSGGTPAGGTTTAAAAGAAFASSHSANGIGYVNRREYYFVHIRVLHANPAVREWRFDVTVTDVTAGPQQPRPSAKFRNLRINSASYVVFSEPSSCVFSPCDMLSWVHEPADLYRHTLRVEVCGVQPPTKIVDTLVYFGEDRPPSPAAEAGAGTATTATLHSAQAAAGDGTTQKGSSLVGG